jgi:ABC-type phosphate transport system substrate-binding protein
MKRIILILALITTTPLFADGYRVVVNTGVPLSSLTKKDAVAIFLKKTKTWDDATPIIVVDQVETTAVRAAFSKEVHAKSVAAIRSFWQQQIFSGRDIPPVQEPTDAAVLERVRKTPGSIGYISDTTPPTGVKVIEIR